MHTLKQILDIALRVIGGFTLVILLSLPLDLFYSSHPEELDSISDFRDWQPDVKTAQQISFGDVIYYGVRGPATRFAASGPSEYYFDANGLYLAMNGDIGDFASPWLFHPNNRLGVRKSIEIKDIPDEEEKIRSSREPNAANFELIR